MDVAWQIFYGKYAYPAEPTLTFTGQTILITGSNVGIGYAAALKFAQHGAARLILGVRTPSTGEAAKTSILSALSAADALAPDIDVWELEMGSYASIEAFAARAAALPRLDAAVLNAGVSPATYKASAYGFEAALQVNTLSTTLLALLLLRVLRRARTATFTPTLEIVCSGRFYSTTLPAETDLLASCGSPEKYDGQLAYPRSKLLLQYAIRVMAELAYPEGGKDAAGQPDVWVVSVCPCFTKSEIGRDLPGALRVVFNAVAAVLARPAEAAARTYVSGVGLGERGHGQFWQHDMIREDAPLIAGEKGERLQKQAWREIVDALKKDIPDFQEKTGVQ